jgi:hypothetical protein
MARSTSIPGQSISWENERKGEEEEEEEGKIA